MTTKNILNILNKKPSNETPIWLMRQAGRYLPEYREIRNKTESFLDLCYNPKLASEVTLQPLKRFNLDAAIIFADILLISEALGVSVKFLEGEGPVLDNGFLEDNLFDLKFKDEKIKNVYETISNVKNSLPRNIALIGFAGSPWTVASYMIEGKSTKDFSNAKIWLNKEDKLSKLIDVLTESTIIYLENQIKAGAEIIQLFDSWSGLLNNNEFKKWVIEPTKIIVDQLKKNYPNIPIIGFPRGACIEDLSIYINKTGINCVSIDYNINIQDMEKLQRVIPVQGNLHPQILIEGGDNLRKSCFKILETLKNGPHIFNLGHGILPQTPIKNVENLVDMVKNF